MFLDVDKDKCCSLCTGHPQCLSWQYTADRTCRLKEGKAEYVAEPTGTVWAGAKSGEELTIIEDAMNAYGSLQSTDHVLTEDEYMAHMHMHHPVICDQDTQLI